jgi:hypothetical protein
MSLVINVYVMSVCVCIYDVRIYRRMHEYIVYRGVWVYTYT